MAKRKQHNGEHGGDSRIEGEKQDSRRIKIDIPECCIACGGPYPSCKDGCPLFDD